MTTNTGGPAFPVPSEWEKHWDGMTLRDYFAAKAMQGMLAAGEGVPNEKLAKWAYDVAGAMLAERAKGAGNDQ